MKILELGNNERMILLDILGFDKDNLRCQFCNKKTSYNECFIMPPIKTKNKATILDSIICFAMYLGELEKSTKRK
jgi:hypothetical protein